MKLTILEEDINITVPISSIDFNILDKHEIESYLKDLMIKLKKKNYNISGFYNVKVYHNSNYGLIIKIIKEDDLELFKELIDLKISVYQDVNMYLEFDDYFLIKKYNDIYISDMTNKYYINISKIKKQNIIKLSEFCNVLLEEDFKMLKPRILLKKVVKAN